MILHFSTHFKYHELNPMRFGLCLFGPKNEIKLLDYNELNDINIDACLVYLSTCNSGFSKMFKGEGPMNLNRAFLLQKVPNLIYSTNRVDDKFAELFATMFYTELLLSKDILSSFSKTKRFFKASKSYSLPFFWNSFKLIASY